ncbi:MAG: hypothetical protein ABFE07_24310 [Armatimonadia bacterium]
MRAGCPRTYGHGNSDGDGNGVRAGMPCDADLLRAPTATAGESG